MAKLSSMPTGSNRVRKALDTLHCAAGYLAAFFMVGVLVMILASIAGRLLCFNLRGSDAYAGYCMAAASFLALGHTLKRGEHIRVTLFLERFGGRFKRPLDLWCHAVGTFFCAILAFYSARLVWQSWSFHDISQGSDATPLWIPQLAMAAGALVLLVTMVDDFVLLFRHRTLPVSPAEELKRIE